MQKFRRVNGILRWLKTEKDQQEAFLLKATRYCLLHETYIYTEIWIVIHICMYVYIYTYLCWFFLGTEARARHSEAQKSSDEFGAQSSWIHLVRPENPTATRTSGHRNQNPALSNTEHKQTSLTMGKTVSFLAWAGSLLVLTWKRTLICLFRLGN